MSRERPPRPTGKPGRIYAARSYAPRPYAALVEQLFQALPSPRGKPWTLQEVADGTGGRLSVSYLSDLRRGHVLEPSFERLALLADFFAVDIRYFLGHPDEPPAPGGDHDALTRALATPLVPEIAARAGALTDVERAHVLHRLNSGPEWRGRPGRPGHKG